MTTKNPTTISAAIENYTTRLTFPCMTVIQRIPTLQVKPQVKSTLQVMSSETANKLDFLKTKNHFDQIYFNSMIDSCSVCRIIIESFANDIFRNAPSARWINTKDKIVLETFSREPSKSLEN